MILGTLKKSLINREFRLFELLQLKKILETRFLNKNLKIETNEWKLTLKWILLVRSFPFFSKKKTLELIEELQVVLDRKFSDFTNEGAAFEISPLANISTQRKGLPDFFNKLLFFNKELREVGSNLIVQGSYADGTQISYSDIDLVIIGVLSEDLIRIKKDIEYELLIFDPLQHHGVFFINLNSFTGYWQMDLPIETLKKALVFSDDPLKININSYFVEKFSSFNWISNFVQNYNSLPIDLNSGAFFVKYFLSQLLLVPALLLAFKGSYVYKRESFSIARKYYSKKAWKCIEIASSIRIKWNQKNIDCRYLSTRKDANKKNIQEFNTLNEVISVNDTQFDEFTKVYSLFIKETKHLLN